MFLFFLIFFVYLPRDVRGSSHAPPASSSIGVGSDVLNMDAATPGVSATSEFDIFYKFLVTTIKTGSVSLGGEYCDPFYLWLGGFGLGVVLILLNVTTIPERNEYKYPS